jgi:hypothetical protein
MSFASYRPIHPDFIVHWTGKDIDKKLDSQWSKKHSSKMSQKVADRYLERLTNILRSGLWMTRDRKDGRFSISGTTAARSNPYRTCFTELRLSEVRLHASKYGRLGIGFKRPFLFERMGAPMIYYQHEFPDNWLVPPPLVQATNFSNKYSAAYFKPMSKRQHGMMHYAYYDESEWRIIYDSRIDRLLRKSGKDHVAQYFERARNVADPCVKRAIASAAKSKKLGFLIPVKSKWLAIIIYPSLAVKVLAESDPTIRALIEDTKPGYTKRNIGKRLNPATFEGYSKPIEIDLDACRNF